MISGLIIGLLAGITIGRIITCLCIAVSDDRD